MSILIPCFNAAKYVGEAIESALNQTWSHIEVIAIDDGSSDGSVEVLESFGDRIRWEAGPNRGACAARNRALALSHGEFIQFLDADDKLELQKIERQLPSLVANEADLVFCRGCLIHKNGDIRPKKRRILSPKGVDPFVFCLSQGLATEGPLHRRTCLEAVGGFDESLSRGQETELHWRLGALGVRIELIDEHLYQHRDHDGPRITSRRMDPDYNLRLLMKLAETIQSGPPYQSMNDERWACLASHVHQCSIHAFRGGKRDAAREGFRLARELSRSYEYSERWWYKSIAGLCGATTAEELLSAARWVRDCLASFRPSKSLET